VIAEHAKRGDTAKDYVILPQNLSVEPLAFGIKKGEATLKAAVDDTLRGLEKSGAAEKTLL
jgi:polar amino acid transport system substrate-binding protein